MACASSGRGHRGTIFVEDATVLSQESFPGRQFVLRLAAPETAARATAGSFVHVAVDPSIPMRRPLSIRSSSTSRLSASASRMARYLPTGPSISLMACAPRRRRSSR